MPSLKEGDLGQKGNHKDDSRAKQDGYHPPYSKGLTCRLDTDEQQDQNGEKEEIQEIVSLFDGECQERACDNKKPYDQSVLHVHNQSSCQERSQECRNDILKRHRPRGFLILSDTDNDG